MPWPPTTPPTSPTWPAPSTTSASATADLGRRAEASAPHRGGRRHLPRPRHRQPRLPPPDLASALNNLGIRYSRAGPPRRGPAPTEEAVDIYRALAADNPAYLPDLASALNNLGNRYSELGRRTEALPPTEEAVDIYRGLATDNPAYLPDLASALNNLGNRFRELGGTDDADRAWTEFGNELPPSARAVLLAYRSGYATAGEPRAASWLASALLLAGGDDELVAAAHGEARRHYDSSPENWQRAWSQASGQPAPAWLLVNRELLGHAHAWRATVTYEDEYRFLAEHPELLAPAADVAVDETLLGLSDEAAARYRHLRQTAREDGVDAAYRPLLLWILAAEFVRAEPTAQRRLLDTHRADLLHDQVRNAINNWAAENATPEDVRAAAVLTLASGGAKDGLLDAVYAAIEQPDQFPELLRSAATDPRPAAELEALAQIAVTYAATDREIATALLYAAVASAENDPEEFRVRLSHAHRLAPDRREEWTRLLLSLRAARPAVLDLLDALFTEPSEE